MRITWTFAPLLTLALSSTAFAQARTPTPGFNGRDATYEISGGSQLRAGPSLTDRLVYTVWERSTVKGSGACTDGACPITFNGKEVFVRRSRVTLVSGGSPATPGQSTGATGSASSASGSATAAGYPPGWSRLQRGDRGDKVRQLQDLLIKAGAKGLTTDGNFGRATVTAVRDLQRRKGLPADGVVGPATLRALGV